MGIGPRSWLIEGIPRETCLRTSCQSSVRKRLGLVLIGVRPAAAGFLIWGKRDGAYKGGVLIWEVLRCCCHAHELLLLLLLVVAPEKKGNTVRFK